MPAGSDDALKGQMVSMHSESDKSEKVAVLLVLYSELGGHTVSRYQVQYIGVRGYRYSSHNSALTAWPSLRDYSL